MWACQATLQPVIVTCLCHCCSCGPASGEGRRWELGCSVMPPRLQLFSTHGGGAGLIIAVMQALCRHIHVWHAGTRMLQCSAQPVPQVACCRAGAAAPTQLCWKVNKCM